MEAVPAATGNLHLRKPNAPGTQCGECIGTNSPNWPRPTAFDTGRATIHRECPPARKPLVALRRMRCPQLGNPSIPSRPPSPNP
jgi:hypothetical protein